MADGEFRASKLMTEATRLYGEAPVAVKLREQPTLAEIAREKTLIVITQAREIGAGAVTIFTGVPKKSQKENNELTRVLSSISVKSEEDYDGSQFVYV
jgi:hypothetical protein